MFHSIAAFEAAWKSARQGTQALMDKLTDESLRQRVAPDHRTLGALAWHLVQTIPEMMNRTGLNVLAAAEDAPTPATAAAIARAYAKVSEELLERVAGAWGDADLEAEDDMYGQRWKRGLTLRILIDHQTHHGGQMTVLMRQAGLRVPGHFGPAREEWSAMGMEPPPND